jgi:hypothetical protein
MPLPFDATLKDLARRHPGDYVSTFRLGNPSDVHALNVDLSVISAATDVVLGHGEPLRSIVDLNFQSGPDATLAGRVCLYNAALFHRFSVPVHSVVILLRPAADHAGITGRLTYTGQPRRGKLDFRYEVIRIWEIPADRLLRRGPGVLPLSVLGALPAGVSLEEGIADVVARLCRRAERTLDQQTANHVLTSTFVLSGLRLQRERARNLFPGIRAVEESTTYQYIIEQGEVKVLKRLLLRHGTRKLGAPAKKVKAAIEQFDVDDLRRLERMFEGIATATSWDEILQTT